MALCVHLSWLLLLAKCPKSCCSAARMCDGHECQPPCPPGLQSKRPHGWLTWSLPVTHTVWNSAAEMSGFALLWLLLLAFVSPPPQNVSWKSAETPTNTHICMGHLSSYHVFRPDANAGVDQGAGQVQSEDQDPPADPGKPRRTAAPEGAEERQRVLHPLRLLLLDGCRAPQAGGFSQAFHVLSRHQQMNDAERFVTSKKKKKKVPSFWWNI